MKKIFNAIIMSLILVFSALSVSAARLPAVGEDSNQWGTILNDYLQVSHDENGTLKATLSPTFDGLTLTDRLIIDSPGPTFSGASSRQTVQADAIFSSFTGTYGAGVMGNAVSGTIGAGDSIIGGIIGKYNLVDSSPSDHPQGAVIGEIGEDVGTTTLPDGAFIAVLGGDTAEVDAGAAYTVRYLNSVPGSKFDYGLDLSGAAIDLYSPVTYGTADIRLSNGATIYNNDANTLTITEGTIVLAGDLTLNSGVINTTEILDGTITTDDVAADTLTAADLAANSVTDSELADNAVDSGAISANAVAMADLVRGTNGQIIVANTVADSAYVSVSGDATLAANGALTIASGAVTGPKLGSNSVTTSKIDDGTITNIDINSAAAIDFSKLASLTSGNILVGSSTNVPTSVVLSGDGTISNVGVLTIAVDSVALGADTTGGYAASTTEGGPATTATALAANGANCAVANQFALGVDASGIAECAAIVDADVPDTITASNYVLKAGDTMTGTLAMGTNSITMTGSLAATGARVTKGWFTDIESTNMPTVGGTSLSSTFQASDADLTTYAGITPSANIQTLLGSADFAAARTSLGAAASGANSDITSLGTLTTIDINGGTIDGATIGGASAAAGTFTTLTATGSTSLGDATDDKLTINDLMKLVPRASVPSSPSSGDIYVDSTPTPDELCFYDGAAWQGISSGTDANCA